MKSFNQTMQYNALSHYLKEHELLLDYIYKFLVTILIVVQGVQNNHVAIQGS